MKLSVLSLNTWMGGIVWQPMIDFLKSHSFDLLFLQEVYDGKKSNLDPRFRSRTILESLFPNFHSDFLPIIGDLREKEGLVDNGNLLLSRWPIADIKHVFINDSYQQYDHDATEDFSVWPSGFQQSILALPDNTRLQVVNLHGPVFMDGAFCNDKRTAMVAKLAQVLQTDLPTIIAGDSNATPNNPCWRQLDSLCTSVFHQQPASTFNMRRKKLPGYATASVDVCMINNGLTSISARCLDLDISDHLPLVVELELN